MEIEEVLKEYESSLELSRKSLKELLDSDDAEDKEIRKKANLVCEKMKEIQMNFRDIDRIDHEADEVQGVYNLAVLMNEWYVKTLNINKDTLEGFVDEFNKSLEFVNSFPVVRSVLLDEMRDIVKNLRKEIVKIIKNE